MWLTLLGFFRANPRLLLAGLALIAGLSLLAYERHQLIGKGERTEQAREAVRLDAARKAVAKREVKASKISVRVSTKLSADRDQIHQNTQALLARVKTDVSPSDDAACHPGPLFVRDFNSAALGGSPELPGAGDGHDSPAR